jgi:hypothetical protein
MPSAETLGAICVQEFDDSRSSAIRITYRISLRSSSIQEPRYPSLRVVSGFFVCWDARSLVWLCNNARRKDASVGPSASCPAKHPASITRHIEGHLARASDQAGAGSGVAGAWFDRTRAVPTVETGVSELRPPEGFGRSPHTPTPRLLAALERRR